MGDVRFKNSDSVFSPMLVLLNGELATPHNYYMQYITHVVWVQLAAPSLRQLTRWHHGWHHGTR